MSTPLSTISHHAFDDETECIRYLLTGLSPLLPLDSAITQKAAAWSSDIRKSGIGHGMEAFLQTYGLDTREGVALMCLAEALLRIPDAENANRLIHGTFEGKDWRASIAGDEPWLISAASWSLLLAGKVMDDASETIPGTLHKIAAKLGEPVIRQALKQAMRIIGSQFVLGETMEEGMQHAASWEKKNYRFSYDILGEGARSDAQAQNYLESYRDAILMVGKQAVGLSICDAPGISVKLSALHPRYNLSQRERVMAELMPRLKELLLLAKEQNITVSLDAEEANRLDIELELFTTIFADPAFAGWNGIGFVLQAYQIRAFHCIDLLAELAEKHQRIIPLRLVKGAYWDSEIKHAQMQGLPNYPVFTRKEHTDISYLACANKILQNIKYFYPQFATHNARTVASITELAAHYHIPNDAFEFQRLHGMGEKLHDKLVGDYHSRIYAPIGQHKDLLAYLIRRLLENGANTSFVHLLTDDEVPLDELLADPIAKAKQKSECPLPLPAALYSDRKNSRGLDLGYLCLRESLEQSLNFPPLSEVKPISADQLSQQIGAAAKAFPAWSQLPTGTHCAIVEAIADSIERHSAELISLLVAEAKKTIPDAISEVREAADMCRYYALQARKLRAGETLEGPTGESNRLSLTPRGIFACISPWNFPLAIFTGQVVAALASGNGVIAKPAEQTPRIAMLAVKLMHEAGIPKDMLQLAIGKGSLLGPVLTSHPNISGVVFTGSVEVAQSINRLLAARSGEIIPFIAETGGQNCMLVDSSALLEQAVDDILLSAFGSAGQRCSALRVLYVQEEIADSLISLLKGAMQELSVGDPRHVSTDIPPVIDARAQQELLAHIDEMKKNATFVASAPKNKTDGTFVLPHAFEITSLSQLKKENFGPILHIIRFKASEMDKVANEINATGYGLTFGIHSRIEENIQFFLNRIQAGNHYVNRSMIGAVVGVQPFGGVGLSGTGPKAGGPYYLLRFLQEKTVSINSAAIGGNVALLSGN